MSGQITGRKTIMNETELQLNSVEEKKARIRQRYKGVDENQLSVIPAIPRLDIFDKDKELRVAVYARVSTDDPNQTSSYELQKNYYTDMVNRNPNWHLVDIYADEGISGTSLQHRDNFLRMIADCEAGKIDLIVTKSVSRFARNLIDSVGYIRKLGAMNPPVGVFFETENLNTLNSQSEMTIAFLSTMAQEESHTKSEIMDGSLEMRFKRGIFLTPALLGYDVDEDGNLVINEEEAKTVRLIFFLYLFGYTTGQIADTLMQLGRETKKGNVKWASGTVLAQLQNERHCGSVLARKTWTPSYLDHKSKKNRQNKNQYFQEIHHEPIISREDFISVQHIIRNTRCGNKNILPVLQVIPDGTLAGYVSVNPRWKGFKPEDYLDACRSVPDAEEQSVFGTYRVEEGEPDLRGFEIVRSQFMNVADKVTVTFWPNKIKFSVSGIRKIAGEYVEILVHPVRKTMIIRKTDKDNRLAFCWANDRDGILIPKDINAAPIMPCLYKLFGWDPANRYQIQGTFIEKTGVNVLVYNINDAEIIMPNGCGTRSDEAGESSPAFSGNIRVLGKWNGIVGYPLSWAKGFGTDYYTRRRSSESLIRSAKLPLIIPTVVKIYNPNPDVKIPSPEYVAEKIKIIMKDIKGEEIINE